MLYWFRSISYTVILSMCDEQVAFQSLKFINDFKTITLVLLVGMQLEIALIDPLKVICHLLYIVFRNYLELNSVNNSKSIYAYLNAFASERMRSAFAFKKTRTHFSLNAAFIFALIKG
jgi:hypothetical protein